MIKSKGRKILWLYSLLALFPLTAMTHELTPDVADISHGAATYQARCVLCHGTIGLGDGRMSKIIKEPPPYNLTLSRAPDEYLKQIILLGGEPMGRSKHMPPWVNELSEVQVESVILYIKSLRK